MNDDSLIDICSYNAGNRARKYLPGNRKFPDYEEIRLRVACNQMRTASPFWHAQMRDTYFLESGVRRKCDVFAGSGFFHFTRKMNSLIPDVIKKAQTGVGCIHVTASRCNYGQQVGLGNDETCVRGAGRAGDWL